MRIRTVKPEFWQSEQLAEVSRDARLVAIALLNYVDREGRCEDRGKRIKAVLFPYDADLDLELVFDELARVGYLVRYEIEAERYLAVVKFAIHQQPHYKELPSELPAPPGLEHTSRGQKVNEAARRRIFERDGNRCQQCGSTEKLSIDHISPWSLGGSNDDENLQTLCRSCNARKSNKVASSLNQGQSDVVANSIEPPNTSIHSHTPEIHSPDPESRDPEGREFEEFYSAYPKHEAPKDARRAWAKLKPSPTLTARIMADFPARYAGVEPKYTPQPARYLNGRLWEGDLPSLARASPAHVDQLSPGMEKLKQIHGEFANGSTAGSRDTRDSQGHLAPPASRQIDRRTVG